MKKVEKRILLLQDPQSVDKTLLLQGFAMGVF